MELQISDCIALKYRSTGVEKRDVSVFSLFEQEAKNE